MKWCALFVLAACGSDPVVVPDAAPSGPATVVMQFDGVGRVVSDPPGIRCGECDWPPVPPGQPVTQCSQPVDVSTCSAVFEIGTAVGFGITEQQVYFSSACFVDGVSFEDLTITGDVIVSCRGFEALTSGAASSPSAPGDGARE